MPKNLAAMTSEERRKWLATGPLGNAVKHEKIAALRDADRHAGVASVRAIQEDIIAAAEKAAQLADCPACENREDFTPLPGTYRCTTCMDRRKVPKHRRALLLAAEEIGKGIGVECELGGSGRIFVSEAADFLRTFEPEGME